MPTEGIMMMFREKMPLAALTVILLAGAAAPAVADTGFYVGVVAGQSLFHQSRSETDGAVADAFVANGFSVLGGSSSLDKTDLAFGGVVGYQFLRSFSIEAGYVDLGKLNYNSNGTVTD